jgi:RHS repeat-associated protein
LVISNTSGNWAESIKYYSFGAVRSGSVSVSRKFTGQILDITGLYYYGARYYDPTMGRFISADSLIPQPANPQSLNRYSYVLNNPLKYADPTGHAGDDPNDDWVGWGENTPESFYEDTGYPIHLKNVALWVILA